MRPPTAKPGLDVYWDAVPLDEIVAQAKARARECGAGTTQEIRECAEQAARASLCVCLSEEKHIVSVVVDEFERQVELEVERQVEREVEREVER